MTADRVVLITGATGGLGRVAAARFAADGARVGLVGTDRGRLDALAGELGLAAGSWVAAAGDLRAADDANRTVAEIAARFGRIDVVLHLVGGWAGGTTIAELDPAEMRGMLDQHLWTTLNVARAALPGMLERGRGRFVAISSTVALEGTTGMASYAVAKAAEEALLRTLAREVAGTGVTANVLVVRKIDAEHERDASPSPKNATWATPEELVAAMVYLCSDAGSVVNGTRIPLTGRG
jgi:NAD(P)-dependent dehydrogenase (short-subunit alcohol dehydrogenase family)